MAISKINRNTFFLAVNTGYVNHGLPTDQACEFYAARSGHGLSCAIVGNVVIPDGQGTNEVCSFINEHESWRKLAKAISDKGATPGIQLSSTWPEYLGMRRFTVARPSENLQIYKNIAKTFDQNFIDDKVSQLISASELAYRNGFTHIQLHAAHGYLFNLLIDPRFCAHAAYFQDSIKEWALQLGKKSIQTSLRFSLYTGEEEIDKDHNDSYLSKIISLPFDFFDASAGFYNINKHLIYPSNIEQLKKRHDETFKLALNNPQKNFILSGRSLSITNFDIPKNLHIGICRDLIANPNFLKEKSNGCSNCMKCHYFSRKKENLTCGLWN